MKEIKEFCYPHTKVRCATTSEVMKEPRAALKKLKASFIQVIINHQSTIRMMLNNGVTTVFTLY